MPRPDQSGLAMTKSEVRPIRRRKFWRRWIFDREKVMYYGMRFWRNRVITKEVKY